VWRIEEEKGREEITEGIVRILRKEYPNP